MTYEEKIKYLISHPEELIKKKPFTRGGKYGLFANGAGITANLNDPVTATLPSSEKVIVEQWEYLHELDPNCHKVLFDDNIPSITMKTKDGGFVEIEYKKMAIPFQQMIKNKHLLHLCGNRTQFTLIGSKPNAEQRECFVTFKEYWNARNQDGMRAKMVDTQMSMGDAGLLYYFDRQGRIKSRLLAYSDGFVLCSHNDHNGDRILESVYYSEDDIECIDSYDDTYVYRHRRYPVEDANAESGWVLESISEHGFSEIPLVTKRGKVAWENVQSIIEVYEVIYNIFMVIQKRHGWGILYVKGKFSQNGQKVAGAIILNDTSMDGNGSAEFKTPPSPQGMFDTLDRMEQSIQMGSGTTFLLPKDVKMSGDISGIAIELSQSFDNEEALTNAIEWQNVIDKMCRLFKEGLSKELVKSGIDDKAVTKFEKLNIAAKFKPWKPRSESEYNQMLCQLTGSGLLSKKTGIQKNTESTPDEENRIEEEAKVTEQKDAMQQATIINESINE